jgi:hypothetical protein
MRLTAVRIRCRFVKIIVMKNSLVLLLIWINGFGGIPQNCCTANPLLVEKFPPDSFTVALTWEAHFSRGMIGYVVERRETNGPWLIIYQTESQVTEYSDSTATSMQAHYRVRSYGVMTHSGYSDVTRRILLHNSSFAKRNKQTKN